MHSPLFNLNNITDAHIQDFIRSTFHPNRIVLVGTGGVDHEHLVKIAADTYRDAPHAAAAAKTPSHYVGGADLRIVGTHETHVALAFQGASLGAGKDFFATSVLQHILGGSRNYFREGVGRSASRLARALEKNTGAIDELESFNYSYSDSGIVGVSGVAHSGHGAKLLNVLTSTLSGVKNVEKEEVDRARNQFKATVLQNIERRLPLLEFVGTSVLATGKAVTPEDFVKNVDNVTVDDIRNAAKKILSSRPTLVALGDVAGLPVLDDVRASLQ